MSILIENIKKLNSSVEQLINSNISLKSDNESLLNQVSSFKEENQELQNEINNLKQQLLNNNEQNLVSVKENEEAKVQIDELVNEIDQCIALLK